MNGNHKAEFFAKIKVISHNFYWTLNKILFAASYLCTQEDTFSFVSLYFSLIKLSVTPAE